MALYRVTDFELTQVANAIREKGGTSEELEFPDGYVEAIENISADGTDVSDTTATASDVLSGKEFYTADGTKTEGTIQNGSVSVSSETMQIDPALMKFSLDNSLGYVTANVSASKLINPNVTPGYITEGKSGTLFINCMSGYQLPTLSTRAYMPTTTDQIISKGKFLKGNQTIYGDENLIAGNIKKDVDIFGVTGTYEGSGGGGSSSVKYTKFTWDADNSIFVQSGGEVLSASEYENAWIFGTLSTGDAEMQVCGTNGISTSFSDEHFVDITEKRTDSSSYPQYEFGCHIYLEESDDQYLLYFTSSRSVESGDIYVMSMNAGGGSIIPSGSYLFSEDNTFAYDAGENFNNLESCFCAGSVTDDSNTYVICKYPDMPHFIFYNPDSEEFYTVSYTYQSDYAGTQRIVFTGMPDGDLIDGRVLVLNDQLGSTNQAKKCAELRYSESESDFIWARGDQITQSDYGGSLVVGRLSQNIIIFGDNANDGGFRVCNMGTSEFVEDWIGAVTSDGAIHVDSWKAEEYEIDENSVIYVLFGDEEVL